MPLNKRIFLVLACTFIYGTCLAQDASSVLKKHNIGFSITSGVLTGDRSDTHAIDLGGEFLYLRRIGKKQGLGASIGFHNYFSQENEVDDFSFMPVTLSIRRVLGRFVLGGDFGYAFAISGEVESNIFLSPKISFLITDRIPVYFGIRNIFQEEDDNIFSLQAGIGFAF